VHVDVMTVPQPLDKVGDLARRTQAAGFSGLLFTETGRTAYLNAAVASQAAPGLELSTGVAVAFPRSPFVTAATAWELQEATGGKFRLGLGTQGARMWCGGTGWRSSVPGRGCATTCWR
jgi:alkanesulfonate monooxygenase SsuD/methylene tetrahydromethanopterin reductase-like flavin-dependent oxidoreductase (luciferase family)